MDASLVSKVVGRVNTLQSLHKHGGSREKPFYEWVSGMVLFDADQTESLFENDEESHPSYTDLSDLSTIIQSDAVDEPRLIAVLGLDKASKPFLALMLVKS